MSQTPAPGPDVQRPRPKQLDENVQRAHPRRVRREERQAMALQLRKQGGSYRQIAEQLRRREDISPKYHAETARLDVIAGLERVSAQAAELAPYVRDLELERLDDLWTKLWPKALAGDILALDRCMAIMDRRARYLGLYHADRQAAEQRAVAEGPAPVHIQIEIVRDREAGAKGVDAESTPLPEPRQRFYDAPALPPGAEDPDAGPAD